MYYYWKVGSPEPQCSDIRQFPRFLFHEKQEFEFITNEFMEKFSHQGAKNKDEILLLALRNSDKKAYAELFRTYYPMLCAYCHKFVSLEDAEEIVQDTFTKLWMYRASIRQEESLTRFLFQITKNLLINRFHSVLNSPLFEEFVTASHEAASTEKESASSRLEFEEFREMLLSAIRQLPATQQKIVHCRLFDELTPPETAQKLQLSEQTVRNQFSMALKHLRQFLLAKNLAWLFFYLLSVIKT